MTEAAASWRRMVDVAVSLPEARQPEWLIKIRNAPAPAPTNRKRIGALSGGKDSCGMALALTYFEPADYKWAITPTGNELPEMVAHWKRLAEMLDAPLLPVSRQSLQGLIREQRALPNHRARWCTRILKLDQFYGWLATQTPCISYVGLRADEEGRTGMLFPDADGVQMDFPMRRWGWTIEDVRSFLEWVGLVIPERTDCAMCFWQKIGEWYILWRDHLDLYVEAEELELWVQAVRGENFTLRSPERDSWPASLFDLRHEFENGRIPTASLARMDKTRLVGACRACTL